MKRLIMISGIALGMSLGFQSCKPKDSDLKTSIEEKFKNDPSIAPANVAVTDAVVTLSGNLQTEAAKITAETTANSVKGVKSVTNQINVDVAPAPPADPKPIVIAEDEVLQNSVKDAVKDYQGVTATVTEGTVTLSGSVTKENQRKLMMTLNGLHPKKITNNLTIK